MLAEGIPIGFEMGLVMQRQAMVNYANMSDEEREKVLDEARRAESKQDMESLINRIGKMNQPKC